ncbi:MAG: ASKHA domain-containing protein [Treponema sp.]|nr:ASKHA domain-containing protein [Treponema sp.]
METTATRLRVVSENGTMEIPVSPEQSLLDALRLAGKGNAEDNPLSSIELNSPCGGKGLCGKCRAKVSGSLTPPVGREMKLLSARELADGYRLLCLTHVAEEDGRGPARVEFAARGQAAILTEGPRLDFVLDPPTARLALKLEAPSLDDQVADDTRLLRALAAAGRRDVARPSLSVVRELALAARKPGLSLVLSGNEIVAVGAEEEAARPAYGLGVDIGTTTLACYLIDLGTGSIVATASGLNEQRSYGADVISRIAAASTGPEGLEALRSAVTAQITALGLGLLDGVGAELSDLISIAIAGNTTMMHLFAGVLPTAIAAAPFPPVFTAARRIAARELDLGFSAACDVWLLPGVSGYVGADIVSGIAALGISSRPACELLLDIGTNGEIALGGSEGIWCCATAAGPAFEGAGIGMGMGGVTGAIDGVWLDGDRIGFSVIGGGGPKGLCGSGVLDALAVFLEAGLVDQTGRIPDVEELASLPPALTALRHEEEGMVRLAVGDGVWLSQADIRNLQLAISAIAAGIEVLMARAGKTEKDVDRVWLAGGFGSYLDIGSALRVGLVPAGLGDRIVIAGNSSGAGAAAACASRAFLAEADKARDLCRYIELSSSPDFTEAYMEHMLFPEA